MGAASALSFAATGLGALGKVDQGDTQAANERQQGQQTAEMDEFKAQQLSDAAQYAKAQGAETDSYMRSKLMTTLGNMQAINASANVESNSPTGLAIAAREQGQGDQARSIKVGDLYAQSAEDQSEAGMYTTAAQQTLTAAYQNSSSSIFGGILGGAQSILQGLSGIKLTS